jgi:ATP-dependent Clp protease ATP-binding subunit ClpC
MNPETAPPPPPTNTPTQLSLWSMRARKSRFSVRYKKFWYIPSIGVALVMGLLALYLFLLTSDTRMAHLTLGVTLFALMWIIWYKTDLDNLAPNQPANRIDDILDPTFLARLRKPVSPRSAWEALEGHWQEIFITNRLVLHPSLVHDSLSEHEADMEPIWQYALKLQAASGASQLHAGAVTAALILSSPQVIDYLTKHKLKPEDVLHCYDWLVRLARYRETDKPYIGGIGRDWAFGYTPYLERFSVNVSMQVESGRGHFHFLARSGLVDAIINNLSRTGGVALVGDPGIGKTSAVFALAQRMFEDKSVGSLKDHQVVSLNASTILSASKQNLEQIMLTLFSEATRAGNMVVFLDEAQLFFKEGTGSFDLSQILLPVLQNRRIKLITGFNTTDYQRLKTSNPALVTGLTPVVISEPSAEDTYKIVEDNALSIEFQSKTIATFEAIKESYRLSGQYMQGIAYPGKAITLLEQATSYADQNVITARSVQQAVEKSLGVKVTSAEGAEASALLNLEDQIHQRMINQVAAVKVVAAALRRARAGVGSSKRPIGSFLFLGPTGVGKTELARSLAATYFGDEHNMIRLDMSEYQQPSDVSRLLDDGNESSSLILSIRKQPFSVVLLDEIEKAHGNILNLLLQLLDEGQLTDVGGKTASFRNAIIILTSNAGSKDILARISNKQGLENFERPLINQLIEQGTFRAELVNRFDEIVLFRSLNQAELMQVAQLMLGEVNKTLANQNISVELTPAALEALVHAGYDPQFGARPMRRVIQRTVEDAMATKILSGEAQPGTKVLLDLPDLHVEPANTASASVPEPPKADQT